MADSAEINPNALQIRLAGKIRRHRPTGEVEPSAPGGVQPEAYRERDEDREVTLTEREVNALLARNTDLARKVAVDLSEDLVSIKLLVPVDEDFPLLGGQTVRLKAGAPRSWRARRRP